MQAAQSFWKKTPQINQEKPWHSNWKEIQPPTSARLHCRHADWRGCSSDFNWSSCSHGDNSYEQKEQLHYSSPPKGWINQFCIGATAIVDDNGVFQRDEADACHVALAGSALQMWRQNYSKVIISGFLQARRGAKLSSSCFCHNSLKTDFSGTATEPRNSRNP